MNPRTLVGCIGVALAGAVCLQATEVAASRAVEFGVKLQASAPVSSSASRYRTLLDRYCVGCHDQKLQTAGLELDSMDVTRVGDNAEIWEKVVQKLQTKAMPPAGLPRPDGPAYKAFVSWLESALDAAAAAAPNPGRPAIHRLNRSEYANAV